MSLLRARLNAKHEIVQSPERGDCGVVMRRVPASRAEYEIVRRPREAGGGLVVAVRDYPRRSRRCRRPDQRQQRARGKRRGVATDRPR